MYILKNALKGITRSKGRNILIGIIIVVISASCAITLSIRNSANNIVSAYESKYEVEATIGMSRENLMNNFKNEDKDREEMIESFNEIEQVTVEEINNYGNSEYVKNYYYVYSLGMNSSDMESATDSLVKETTTTKTEFFDGGGMFPGGGRGGQTTTTKTEEIKNMRAESGEFTLSGYSSYEGMTEFIEGTYTITDGSVSSDFTSNTCVISEELATLNEISIGDKITLTSPKDEDITYELEVTGIYTENSSDANNMNNMFTASANNIITNNTVIENILAKDEELNATITPTFILINSDVADQFASEVKTKGLSEYYTVTNNLEEVESATKSITNVKTFATTFLIITLIIGGVVLLVINMINIRERKYEIGVLRTIGMSKLKVISQFVIELLIVSLVSLLIGAGIGSLCSVSVANNLLETEISNALEDVNNIDKNFGGGMIPNKGMDKINGIVNVNEVDSINAVVDFKVLIQLLAIGLSLTLISSISSCVGISRFSPLNILKERS